MNVNLKLRINVRSEVVGVKEIVFSFRLNSLVVIRVSLLLAVNLVSILTKLIHSNPVFNTSSSYAKVFHKLSRLFRGVTLKFSTFASTGHRLWSGRRRLVIGSVLAPWTRLASRRRTRVTDLFHRRVRSILFSPLSSVLQNRLVMVVIAVSNYCVIKGDLSRLIQSVLTSATTLSSSIKGPALIRLRTSTFLNSNAIVMALAKVRSSHVIVVNNASV